MTAAAAAAVASDVYSLSLSLSLPLSLRSQLIYLQDHVSQWRLRVSAVAKQRPHASSLLILNSSRCIVIITAMKAVKIVLSYVSVSHQTQRMDLTSPNSASADATSSQTLPQSFDVNYLRWFFVEED